MKIDRRILRILDANLNRSREGLRVCEEVFRFFLNEPVLTKKIKRARHEITQIIKSLPVSQSEMLASRDVDADEGRKPSNLGSRRTGFEDIFLANIERTKESLRALEEFSKLFDQNTSDSFKKIRFQVYAIEKQALPKLESLRDHRFGGRKKGRSA